MKKLAIKSRIPDDLESNLELKKNDVDMLFVLTVL